MLLGITAVTVHVLLLLLESLLFVAYNIAIKDAMLLLMTLLLLISLLPLVSVPLVSAFNGVFVIDCLTAFVE
jgi:hypothetical protein